MNDDVLKLYNSLQKYGYNNLGTSEEFGAKVQDSTSRRKLYDSLTRDGFGNLGTFEEFSGRLVKNGDTASEETATATAAKPAQETPAQTEQKEEAKPAPADNSKWAVPQSFDWKAQAEEMRRSVMPGEPVSMPEKKAEDTPSKAEPEGNPFPYRGELENELNELRDRYAKASEQNAENVRLIEEYDRRMKEFHDSLDPTSKKTRENEKWLREHKSAYMAAKDSDEMKEYARAKAEYEETARAMGNAREKIAERKNREEMASPAEVIATGKTVFGGDNAGRSDSEYKYRKLADELYKSAGKEYDWSSKNDEGYNGGFMDKLWTATKQFVADAGNNIDSGSLTFGLSKGLAEKEAREVGDKYNGIITGVLKDMKMSDGDIKAVLSSIAMNGEKLQAMNEELKTEGAEIDTMMSTYDDMVRRGDPDARSYGEALQKRIDAYNKRINEEYKPLSETYDRDREAYETVMSAIDSAVESGLTGGEKALLDAMEKFTEAKTLSEPVRSTASKAGAGAEQSAEFMLDFILTGGISKAGTKAATKLATNRALKKYGADFLKDLASVGKSVKPGLGLRLGTDVVTSLARTGVMFPRTIQAYGENAIEYSGKDYAGRIDFDRTQANAIGNALLTQFIEYWSEGFGEYFGEAEQALFRNVTKSAPVETIGKTLRGYRGSIGQYLDKGKFDGMFNEMLEEVVGSSFNALAGWMSGDRVGDAGAMKEFFAGENLATLALSFLPMSAIGAATNIKAYHKMKERYDAGVQALNPFIESGAVSRKELEQLSKDIPNMTPNQIKDKVVDIADRARKSNGGKLPEDFAKNLLGYVEGEFAMGLRYDEWEESREKMSVVNSYASNYANPDPRSAWDLNDAEQTAKKAALDAGFSEEELDDNDSYILAQEAFELKGTEPERADVLMNYANAKASVDGLRNGYKEQGDQIAAANEEFVRSNLDVNGKVIMAVVNENGVQKPAFILSEDAEVAPDGTVSTPTGNGVVKYVANRNGRFEKESTIISGNVSMAREVGTDEYVADQTASLQQRRAEIFDAAQKAVSPTGQARAIYQRLGHTVIVDDHNGVYEPFMVESMTDDGTEVVISGDKKALQGVARSIGLEIPPSKYLKAPIAKLYPILAKNDDGSLSTGLGEKPEQNETEATPATESVEQTAQAETAAEQTPDVADLRDKNVTISDNGVLKTAHVLSTDDGRVVYEELDGNGDVVRTTFLPADAFTRAMQEAETPAPAPAEEVVEETPAEEATAQEEETELPEETAPFIPVDEKTGEKIYDAPGVEVSDAIEDLYKTDGLSEEDVDMYIADRASKAEAARNPERGDMSPAAWGQAKKEAARVADFWNAMKQAAEARKKQTAEEEEKKKEDAAAIGTPGQPEGGAGAVTPNLPASEDKDTDNSENSNTSAERNSIERKLARRLKRWEKRTGIKVHVRNSIDEVTDQAAKEGLQEGRLLTGWFIPETGEVEIYMPNISSEAELDRSFIHEVVSHKGLRELLGEEGYNALCDRVWDELMTDGDKEYYTGYNRHLDAVGEAQRRAAADEYIARLSENLDFYDNRSIFQKLVDWIKRILGEELSVGELEYDAQERAAGATASMTDDVLRVILSDSMKRYVETTRRGQQDAGAKREIGSEVGGAMDTDASGNKKGQTRFSMKSIVNGGGLEVLEDDGSGNVAFVTTDGRKFNAKHPITARDLMGLENTVMFHMMKDARDISHLDPQKEMRIWQAYADQLNAFLQKGVAKDGLSGADRLKALWQWEVENSVYRSVAPNSDEQYKYSLDITRVCKKNEATIRAISAMQRKLGAGLTPGQVMDVYMAGIEEGYQVPCPVCYVFSRYINNGIVATIAINGQKTWGADLVDPSTLSEEEKRERIAMWKARLDEQEAFNAQNKKQIEQAKKDCASIIEEIDELSYQISSGKLKGKERTAAEKRVKLLDNRYRAAFDLVSQSALTQWIKQFAIRQTKNGYAPTADGKAYELWEDTFQGFPEEYALDLRLTAETIEKYPAIQRLRKARGAAGGKEIHFASNNDVGDIPMMLGADNSVNFYQKAVNARTEKERKYFLGKATERFKNAHKYAQQQSLRGGQRMWSWSDNIERLAPDVFVNLLQLQMLGGALQSYSKQLEGVNLVANLQGYVNGSLMGYGKGWTELKPEDVKVVDGKEVLAHDIKDTVTEKRDGQEVKRERYLAKEGSPVITVDGKKVTLLFDDVVGIDPYGRDVDGKHLKGLFDLNGELDKAGNILVGMNDTHIIAAMADDRVFFIIPWHASGNSIHQVQQMLNGLGVKTMVKDYMDYTKVQEEKDMDKKKKSAEEADFVDEDVDVSKEEKIEEADPIRQEIIDFWESHKNESDRVEKGLPLIPSGENGKLSDEQKRYRKLRDAIFDGLFDELPKKDQDAITSDAFLSQVLRKVNKVVDDKEMTAGDKKFIYPYEYWNEQSTYDTADENGARYLEYCRRLGYKPKFVGKLDSKAKTDFGNFADYKGYWKLLIDRRMYDVNGRFQDLDPVTTDNYDPRTVDPEWTAENFPLTAVADDPGAERIADRAIEKEGRTFKDGVPTANYGGDIQSAVKKYEMVSKLVDLKPAKPKKSKKGTQFRDASGEHDVNSDPQVSEGGVTMFRERTAPAPQKTQKVYKLMRLDNGNLYPLFIDRDAEPIKLGTWYDADSPDMEFLKKMPSGVFLVDAQNGTYTSLEDYKKERGEKVNTLPSKSDVEEAAKNGLRWMKISDTERAQRRYGGENRKYENIGINGSEGVSTFAMRPGWHAGSLPTMRQIGKGAEKNLRDDKFVWVEGEISADKDYNEEAQGNPDKDIPTHIPTDGFYMKATNANKKASQADRVGWYVAGAFKPNRIMSDSEARQVIDAWNAEHQDAPVEYDWPRESGKVFNAETMSLEDENPEPNGPNGGGTRFREVASDLYDGYENQNGEDKPWMSEGELIDRIEEELPYGLDTKELFAKIDEYRRLDEEDFNEGRRDFSGSERDNVFQEILSSLKKLAEGESAGTRFRENTATKQDQEYMDAVNSGDMEKAQEMVDLAAEAAGYTTRGYHGTTHNFTIFDRSKGNAEGDWGKGFYFTTSRDDADVNYGTDEGPDLTNRIELLAENMEWMDGYEDLDYEERLEKAREMLAGDNPHTISAAVRMENPLIIDSHQGAKETFFDYNSGYNYETDEYEDEESGLLLDFINAWNGELNEWEWEGNYASPEEILEYADDGGLTASQLEMKAREILDSAGIQNSAGELASGEFLRSVFERMGFDGIIDENVNMKFGSQRRYGRGMDGMDAETAHIIAFSPNQIKQTDPITYDDNGNVIPLSERFNPENNDIRFREKSKNDDAYMEAVNGGDLGTARRLVRDEFKALFPNTKVVDENGDPLVVYHGTWEDPFNVFRPNEWLKEENGDTRIRGYFSYDPEYASNYGPTRPFFLNIENPLEIPFYDKTLDEWKRWFADHGVKDVKFDSSIEEDPLNGADYGDGVMKYYPPELFDSNSGFNGDGNLTEKIEEAGYDGLHYPGDESAYVAFSPNQIKLAEPVTYDDAGNAVPLSDRFNRGSEDIRFRDATPLTGNAQLDYENEIRSKLTQFLVEWQDGDIPVRIAMNKIMNEVGLEHISDDMDYLTRHNLASSIADAQMHQYKLFYYEPMMKTVSEIVDKLLARKYNVVEKLTGQKRAKQDEIYNELVDFCYAMSGLERNAWKRAEAAEKMAKELERLADKWENESEDINADSRLSEDERSRALTRAENRYLKMRDEIEAKYAPRDYSGITDLMGRPKEEWQEAEADAQNMVDAFRDRLGDDGMIDELWDRIRACTDFNLEHAYKYGLLTRTEYERLHGTESQPRLWQYYMPLRGFSERTAEDEYAYSMFTNDLAGGDVVKEAKGRTTKADDPFATMRHISELELIQGLNNWAKQALYNFVLTAGENTLLTQVEPWYVKEAGTDNWIAAEPNEGESLEEFENRMQEARSNGEARKGRNGLKLGLILGNKMHRNQHMIRLKVNGQEKMIWVNGSPLLAQVVNGVRGWDNKVVNKIRGLNRSLSQFYTTYSAKFLTKNKMRDTQFSRIAALVDESQPYLRQLEKNWWANNGYGAASYPMILLVAEWNSGKLEKKENRTEREQMFIDFMYDGGATGYTMRNTMDQIKRELEKMVKNAGRGERNIPIIDWYAKGIGALNEASELLTRFTFYQTSRMMGRSRQRAAYDAKESSVNFNRRGLRSGVGVSGFTSALASVLYLFMNPAIQGLDKFVRLHKSHPWSMGLVDATYFMMGFVNSLLNAMVAGFSDGGDGDDDEKKMGPDWYWNIPEWVRRSNMIIGSPFKKLGKWGYLVIALPIEYKGFYAMGELASAIVQGKYAAKDTPTIANEVVGVVSELMPINPVEGYTPGNNVAMSVVRNLMPDFAAPIMDVATNRSFAGIPLWKENIYDETEPLSQSAFASTPEILNKVVIKLAEATADKPWHVDIPSGALRGVLKGYGGGAYNFVEDLGKFVFADASHPRRYENFPFVSGFSGYLEEDRRDSFNSDALQRYKELSKDVVKRIRSAAPGEDITEAMVYNHPEDLPKEAKVQTILHADEWLLGKMYFDGIKQKSGQKESKVNKKGDVYTVDVKDDIGALRKAWKKAKDEYIAIAEDKNSTQEQKDAALENVQKAWVKFTDSEDALVDRLLEEEYYHVKQKIDNGIPYEPKETLGEKAYKLTNRK